jgi:membrane protein implicated in regulation of membrane protease activity
MLALYLVTAIIGLGLIVFSALGGLSEHGDFDNSVETESEVSTGFGHDLHSDADSGLDSHDADHTSDFWLPFFSLRFWIYLTGGFGGFGLILTMMGVKEQPTQFISALTVGLVIGTVAAVTMRILKKSGSNSSVSDRDFVGLAAKVLVAPVDANPGKIRLAIKNETIDVLALPLDGHTIATGDQVVVVSVDGAHVTVANAEKYLDS